MVGVLRPAETARVAGLRPDHPVSQALAPFVERYWSVRWDRTGLSPYRSEVLSHPAVNVSVETGDRPRFGVALPAVLVHAPVTRRFVVDLAGVGRVTAARFRPGGFTAWTGLAPGRGTVRLLGEELGVPPDRLSAAVLTCDDDGDRAAALDGLLCPLAPAAPQAYLELLGLLEQMRADRGLVRVEDVAARGGLAVRSLQRLFATWVGVAPKAVLARYRLQDAVAAIDAGEVNDLAALAADFGWSDQAHFSRDFRAVVGTTPSAYLRRARTGA
ncbi:MAG TPA: helix-turn-helix domain-containing protein [Pseudonocardia sp.]